HEGRADADVSLDPAVLLMRLAAVQLEQHPEPPPVDGAVMATVTAELRERCRRDQRDLAATAVDRLAGVGLDEPQRLPRPTRECVRPRPVDQAALDRPVVEVGPDRGAERNLSVGA